MNNQDNMLHIKPINIELMRNMIRGNIAVHFNEVIDINVLDAISGSIINFLVENFGRNEDK